MSYHAAPIHLKRGAKAQQREQALSQSLSPRTIDVRAISSEPSSVGSTCSTVSFLQRVGESVPLTTTAGRAPHRTTCPWIPTLTFLSVCSRIHGDVYTSRGVVRIHHAKHRDSLEPLDPECDCVACTRYTRSLLRHLHKCKGTCEEAQSPKEE